MVGIEAEEQLMGSNRPDQSFACRVAASMMSNPTEGDEAVEAEGDEAAADTPLVLPQRKKRRTRSAVIEVVDGDGEEEA